METSVSPVACLDKDAEKCSRAKFCVTLPVWKDLDTLIREYLSGVTLDQFLRNMPETEGKIPGGKEWNCGL